MINFKREVLIVLLGGIAIGIVALVLGQNGGLRPMLVAQLQAMVPHPFTEMCNGRDDDLDGEIDEVCDCRDGVTQPCGTDRGACRLGEMTCSNGRWGDCRNGHVGPEMEINDGVDNDCDDYFDEGYGITVSAPPFSCVVDYMEGVCAEGVWTCSDEDCFCSLLHYLYEFEEIHDGLDNDCDGETDENLSI